MESLLVVLFLSKMGYSRLIASRNPDWQPGDIPLTERGDVIVLATKAFVPMSDDLNHRGSSRRWISHDGQGFAGLAHKWRPWG